MSNSFDALVEQTVNQLENSPLKGALGDALKSSIEKQKSTLESLLQAKQQGQLSQEEFDAELDREKRILQAEMLTKQIAAKADIQKLVNKAMQTLSKGLI